jgi:hypothetical protein
MVGQLSGNPSGVSPAPQSPLSGQPSPTQGTAEDAKSNQDSRLRNRPLRKKIWTPVILAAVGVAMGVGAFALYSSPSELPTPPYATLQLASSFPIADIDYTVDQISSSIAEIKIEVELPAGTLHPPAGASNARLFLAPPFGTGFQTCPKPPTGLALLTTPFCYSAGQQLYVWVQPLKFTTVRFQFSITGAAFADLYVRAHSFGETYNGITAAVAIPAVTYDGSGMPLLEAQYNLPAASSYDWSAFPTQFANGSYARWNEQLSSGVTEGKTAAGTNHANEADDNNKTFIAGVLFGLAGAALLSAVQEALHVND